jgi:hypothetical protein
MQLVEILLKIERANKLMPRQKLRVEGVEYPTFQDVRSTENNAFV